MECLSFSGLLDLMKHSSTVVMGTVRGRGETHWKMWWKESGIGGSGRLDLPLQQVESTTGPHCCELPSLPQREDHGSHVCPPVCE